MKKVLVAFAAALALALPAAAAKPHIATLAASPGDSTVTYAVTFQGKKNDNPYLLWVSHWCYDNADVPATAEFHPVVWDTATTGHTVAFQVPIGYTGNPATGPVVECRAYVSVFPDVWTPRSNTVQTPS